MCFLPGSDSWRFQKKPSKRDMKRCLICTFIHICAHAVALMQPLSKDKKVENMQTTNLSSRFVSGNEIGFSGKSEKIVRTSIPFLSTAAIYNLKTITLADRWYRWGLEAYGKQQIVGCSRERHNMFMTAGGKLDRHTLLWLWLKGDWEKKHLSIKSIE